MQEIVYVVQEYDGDQPFTIGVYTSKDEANKGIKARRAQAGTVFDYEIEDYKLNTTLDVFVSAEPPDTFGPED